MKKQFSIRTKAMMACLLGLAVVVGTGCNRDKCKPGDDCSTNDQELITKVSIEFSDSITGALAFTAAFNDPDGVGGTAATIDSMIFAANTTYNANISVFAEVSGQVEDITPEILVENADHLFCFTASGAALTVLRTDSDGTFPIGLTSRFSAGAAGSGSITVTLKHQPDGAKDGTCAPGDTDVEVVFPVLIQ